MRKLSSGNVIVDQLISFSFQGNVIPDLWYDNIKFKSGKTNLGAIVILADILYWYRPSEIRDESTGKLIGYAKKFRSDLLQRSYEQLGNKFGLTKRQTTDAVKHLEELGVIKRVFRTIKSKDILVNNVLFLELIPEMIIKISNERLFEDIEIVEDTVNEEVNNEDPITIERDTYHDRTGHLSRYNVIAPTIERETYTKTTTETNKLDKSINLSNYKTVEGELNASPNDKNQKTIGRVIEDIKEDLELDSIQLLPINGVDYTDHFLAVMNGFIEVMGEVYLSDDTGFTHVNGREVPNWEFKRRMKLIQHEMLYSLYDSFNNISGPIYNKKAYMLSMLYNLPSTFELSVKSEVDQWSPVQNE